MNKPHLLQKLAPVGVAAIGAIAVTGIATVPAQAATIGSLNWGNTGTDDFINEVNPVEGDIFDVTFGPDSDTTISLANGIFDSPFDPAPPSYILDGVVPAVGEFAFVRNLPPVDGIVQEFLYALTSDLEFNFGNGATVTFTEGSIFQGEFDVPLGGGPVEGVEFAIVEAENVIVSVDSDIYSFTTDPGDPGFVSGEQITFGQATGEERGGIQAGVVVSQGVPEPATIFGLLTISGLGLGLQRKKKLLKVD